MSKKTNFSWSDFYLLAVELSKNDYKNSNLKEAYMRTIVSRAYYAAFCTARDWLVSKGLYVINKETVHQDVPKYFRWLKGLDYIKDFLNDMRSWRNACDYDVVLEEDKDINKMVKESLRNSEKILKALQTK